MTEILEQRIESLEQRTKVLEDWRLLVAISLGKQEVDKDYITKKLNEIETELKDIKKVARNLMYTIYAAGIAYVVKFALSGGFTTPSIM